MITNYKSKYPRHRLLALAFSFMTLLSFSSCTSYDEEDSAIISYLRINDLLENKILERYPPEFLSFKHVLADFTEHSLHKSNVDYIFSRTIEYLNLELGTYYDAEAAAEVMVSYMFEKTPVEKDLSSSLWSYLIYMSDIETIPSKAQNIETAELYTISELKAMYPEYKDVKLEGFAPVPMIETILNEPVMAMSTLTEDVNLLTMYLLSLAPTFESANIDYDEIIKANFGNGPLPEYADAGKIKELFGKLVSGENPMYKNDNDGFKKFVFDYFETDMFTGEDVD